ncbi:MAG: argininosuccinate lyase [Dehalococcoidia bacterium]|nr:argininosuccinate lyase [Dehalococcoidia bacterium]
MLEGKDELVKQYLASIPFDRRLFRQDIRGSLAHAKMLAKQRIITEDDAAAIIKALTSIQQEIEQGEFQFRPELEDIHMNIETRLQEKLGDIAGKLHTARSRNDQIALDIRLFLKEETGRTVTRLNDLQSSLLQLAEANQDVIMPGYTHLQQAQPVLLAHHLLAYFDMLQRDKERFRDCLNRTDVLPLGSGALAGVSYAIDRDFLAQELGFGKVSTNSLDAVSDRDFVVEFEAASALTMMHLSRLAEEIILWTSAEFGFIQIGEAYTTGSSIMPQKRNPDVAELARGKTGRVYGNLVATLTTMKALPLAYNRDMQEDKERVFDTLDTLDLSLQAFAEMIRTVKVNVGRVRAAFRKDYVLATDLADYLVKKGLPFREAHRVVSELSIYAMNNDRCFRELTLSEYNKFSPLFGQDVYDITLESSIAARNTPGGTSLQQVQIALARARQLVERTP